MEVRKGWGGGGGVKGRNFRGVWGVLKRRIFHGVVKDANNRMSHTSVYVDYFDLYYNKNQK